MKSIAKDNMKKYCKHPLKMQKNRVRRTYMGGKLLDKWYGELKPEDGNKPEQWVASTVEARNPDYIKNEGFSIVSNIAGNPYLKDVISSSPTDFLGKDHMEKYDNNMAILVKMLDSCTQLSIQAHPDKENAKRMFNSIYGKTEAWHIVNVREINGEKPYVLLGFKEGIDQRKWADLFYSQDIEGMAQCLHKFEVKQGDTFLIEGGVPHAIGAGVFLTEIQEPTDYTFYLERTSSDGSEKPDEQMHQGIGFENMLSCFSYEGYSKDEASNKWKLKPLQKEKQKGGEERYVISPDATPCFSMTKIDVTSSFFSIKENSFYVAIVLRGKGKLLYNNGEMDIKQSDELFIPASLGEVKWKTSEGDMTIIRCFPPQ